MKLDCEFFNYEKAPGIFTESTRHHQASSNYKKLKELSYLPYIGTESKRHCHASSNVYIFIYFIKKINPAHCITRVTSLERYYYQLECVSVAINKR